MPIYEYRCSSCGSRKEHLQKVSDPRLTACPECGKQTYEKQLTAAGFQLKGSGWYVTDFRNKDGGAAGKSGSGTATANASADAKPAGQAAAKDATGGSSSSSEGSPAAPAPTATPAAST